MSYPLLSRLFLSRYRSVGPASIGLSKSQLEGIEEFKKQCGEEQYSFESVPCLCGSSQSYCIGFVDRYGIETETHLCLRCGILRTNPRLTEESLEKFYTEAYARIYEFSAEQKDFSSENRWEQRVCEQRMRGERLFHEMKLLLPQDRTPVVFDVGCNTGAALLPFKEGGSECYGCDLGSSGFAHGRKEGLTLLEGDESVLQQFAPADFIILSHVLEHLPHPAKTLKKLRGLLREGGYLYIELPGVMQFHRHPLGMMRFLQNAHLYHFTLGTLTDLLRSEGFTVASGNQSIAAFYQKTADSQTPLRRRLCKPYLLLCYVFLVEILYRIHLLPVFTFVSNTVHKGIRHLFRDLLKWMKRTLRVSK